MKTELNSICITLLTMGIFAATTGLRCPHIIPRSSPLAVQSSRTHRFRGSGPCAPELSRDFLDVRADYSTQAQLGNHDKLENTAFPSNRDQSNVKLD